jgi:hypothetical protein
LFVDVAEFLDSLEVSGLSGAEGGRFNQRGNFQSEYRMRQTLLNRPPEATGTTGNRGKFGGLRNGKKQYRPSQSANAKRK